MQISIKFILKTAKQIQYMKQNCKQEQTRGQAIRKPNSCECERVCGVYSWQFVVQGDHLESGVDSGTDMTLKPCWLHVIPLTSECYALVVE